jgi:hypothetical protein
MTSPVVTSLGYCFELVLPLAVGINIGLGWTIGTPNVHVGLQTESMEKWIFVSCPHHQVSVSHYDGRDYCVWFNGTKVPLSKAEAETIAAFFKCECEDEIDA